jgi:hypothetical protein
MGFIEALSQKYFLIYGVKGSNINKIPLRERNGHRVVTSLIRHRGTIPVDGIKLTEDCEETKLADDGKFDFM